MRVLPPTTALPPRARVPVGQSTRTAFCAVELITLVPLGGDDAGDSGRWLRSGDSADAHRGGQQ
jgi:hypothetical protein